MHTVRLLTHQALLVQSPFVNSDIRFHFLIAGYASGKTSGLVYAILHTVKYLLGKKDEEGHNPKILVASKNLTFMKKTLTGLLEQDLRMTCSEYTYDKAHNIITIGNVELLLIPDEDESSIYGFSCYCFKGDTLVATSEGDKRIDEIKAGDLVLTRKGFKRVTHAWCSGVKDCIELTMNNGKHIVCTPDHRFITAQEEEIEAKYITPATDLLHYVTMKDGSVFLELGYVKHIESGIGKQKVYDIEVEDAHEFFANGVLVHNCSFVDELDELDTQTAMAVVKSINDRTRQQIEGMRSCFIVFTTSSQGLKGTYQTVMHFNKSNIGYVLIRARTKDNIYLSPDYIKNMYSIYNEKERDCLLEGKFVSIDSGLIFPDYDPKNNKLDHDLYDFVRNNSEYPIYIGQDFNCTKGNVLIDTLRGKVKMKHIKKGDYVLTRKGYKKVLRKVCKGVKMVQEFNNKLVATPDHVAITPQGEVELCKAKQFYCLKEHSTESLKEQRKALLQLFKLKKLLLKEENITDIHNTIRMQETISDPIKVKAPCIEIYTRNILEKYGKEIISITKTDTMTTDLKVLKKFLLKSTRKNISLKKLATILKLQRKDYQNIICQKKVGKNTVKYLKTLGRKENTLVLLFALIVTNNLKQKSELLKDVQHVKRSGIFIEKENAIKVLKELVLFVENILQGQVQQNIVKNTKIIGKDQVGKEKFSKVYDIEVEQVHEFYANNILVHNCFGNNAVAFTVIDNSIIAIKDYEFPDIRRAPEVFRYDFPENRIVWVPDMTYKEHFSEFKKELRIFKIDLALRKCNPLVGDRNFACNKLFVAQRLFICPMCKGLETTLLTWQKDPRTGQPYKGGKGAPDHKGDCLGYVVHYLLSWKKELKYLYRVTLQRLYDARRARGTQATELEIDSHEINWDKLSFTKLKDAPNVVNNGD